jgi:putative tricarboxylic transport membrane protein
MTLINRRQALAFSTLGLLGARAPAWAASPNPSGWQPNARVEFLVPSGPGAALDTTARKLTSILAEQKAAPSFVVTNRSSAHGAAALGVLQQNPGDPHFLMSLSSSLVYSDAQHALPVPYTEFTPLAILLNEYVAVAVRADSPLRTAQDLVAALRRDPAALSVGVATNLGNHIHLGIAKPLKAGGVDIARLRVAPYKSSAESTTALLGGHLDLVSATTANFVPHLVAGRLRILAVASPRRLEGAYAAVPTWREQGFDAIGQSVQGVLTTRGVSAAAQAYWIDTLRTAASHPDWQDLLGRNQWQGNFLEGARAAAWLAREREEVAQLLKEPNLQPA